MQIHGQNPVGPGGGDQIRNQLGGDGRPGRDFAVLTGISVVGQNGA